MQAALPEHTSPQFSQFSLPCPLLSSPLLPMGPLSSDRQEEVVVLGLGALKVGRQGAEDDSGLLSLFLPRPGLSPASTLP